jgi:DNA-binding SARP family transcriptional activator
VNPQANFWLDIAIFEEAYQKVHDTPLNALSDQNVKDLNEAVDLYRGDLMDGCYQDWCLFERERLQGMYQEMLNTLTGFYEIHQEYKKGLVYAQRLLSCDHAAERTHRLMMRLYYYSGNRTQALRQYKVCEDALRTELDVSPSQKTIELYEQIRADTLPPPEPLQNPAGEASSVPPSTLADALHHMQHIQQTLNEMQSQIQNEIQVIEKVLDTP